MQTRLVALLRGEVFKFLREAHSNTEGIDSVLTVIIGG